MRIRLILLEIIPAIMQAEAVKSHMKKSSHRVWVTVWWLMGAGAAAAMLKPGFIDATPVILSDKDSLIDAQALVDFGELPVEKYFYTRQTNDAIVWHGKANFTIYSTREDPPFAVFRTNTIEELEQYIRVFSADISALTVLGVRLYQTNRVDESLGMLRAVRRMQPDDVRSGELFSGILLKREDTAAVLGEVQQILNELPDNPVVRYNLACAHARIGDTSGAFYHLNVLYQTGWPDLIYHLSDPDFESLRSHPRFQEFQNILLLQYRDRLNQTLLESVFRPKL